MLVRYCNAACQKKHWATHKTACKLRAAELRDEALFKDPPPKEDCPICFLPMPNKLISCVSLPPATISSVPIIEFAKANEGLKKTMDAYYPCCGKTICTGCEHSFRESGNIGKCPFCNSNRGNETVEENNKLLLKDVEDLMKRVVANDPTSICQLASNYYFGTGGLQQDHAKSMELYMRAGQLGCSEAHCQLANLYRKGGNLKKSKFHYEAAAISGHEVARYNLGCMEANAGNMERAVKHWLIAASAGNHNAMHNLLMALKDRYVSRESIDSTLIAYNNSCVEMRSEARDAYIRACCNGNV
jgi:tetratricopeptide (TPR) repeat protein